jgi:hypothetical protein
VDSGSVTAGGGGGGGLDNDVEQPAVEQPPADAQTEILVTLRLELSAEGIADAANSTAASSTTTSSTSSGSGGSGGSGGGGGSDGGGGGGGGSGGSTPALSRPLRFAGEYAGLLTEQQGLVLSRAAAAVLKGVGQRAVHVRRVSPGRAADVAGTRLVEIVVARAAAAAGGEGGRAAAQAATAAVLASMSAPSFAQG